MGLLNFFKEQQKNSLTKKDFKDERKAECPNCNESLNKIPGAKTKCPHCGKFMFVRTTSKENMRVVVTQEDADKIDEEWRILNGTQEEFIQKKEEFEEEKRFLKEKFGGRNPSDTDVQWKIYNSTLLKAMEEGDWGKLQSTYFEMALLLHKEGKKSFRVKQLMIKSQLESYLRKGIKKVEITGTLDDKICDKCLLLDGKILEIEDALRDMPIPCKECSHKISKKALDGWCRCCYSPTT